MPNTTMKYCAGRDRIGPVGFAVALLTLALSTGAAASQQSGDARGSNLHAEMVEFLGDVNNDGVSEILIAGDGLRHCVGSVWVVSGASIEVLHYLETACEAGAPSGYCSAHSGSDVDGDGSADIVCILAVPESDQNPLVRRVVCYSGSTGETLHQISGQAAAAGGDCNKDGCSDIAIANPRAECSTQVVDVFSGKDLRHLHTLRTNEDDAEYLGSGMAWIADMDSDECDDLAVTMRRQEGEQLVLVYSVAKEKIAWVVQAAEHARTIVRVSAVPDLDADECPELAIATLADSLSTRDQDQVRVFSGRNGTLLLQIADDVVPDRLHDRDEWDADFGASVSTAGDQDEDGIPDLLVGAPSLLLGSGGVFIVSGQTGKTIKQIDAPKEARRFGSIVHGGYDMSGDSVADLLVASGRAKSGGISEVLLISGKTGEIISTITRETLAPGGTKVK